MTGYVFLSFMFIASCTCATIPEYIHVCHRNDPEVSKCILQSVEVLRPRLRTGIPELDVPTLEPLIIPEIVISRGNKGSYRAIGRNVYIHGLSNFQPTKLKLDIPNLTFYVGAKFDKLTFNSDIDVDIKVLSFHVKGKGKLDANTTNCIGNVILKAELVEEDGVQKMHFKNVDLDLQIGSVDVHVDDNIFGDNPDLSKLANDALYQNRNEIFNVIKPVAEKTTSDIILNLANSVVKNFAYDEVFPK